MVQAQPQLKTFDQFLAYIDGTDNRYELTNGELVEVPPESDENLYRAMQLYEALKDLVGMRHIRLQGLALAMPGQPRNRYPDLTVLQPEHIGQMRTLGQAAITLEMAPPRLVVEVVSPGKDNSRRDYVDKRNQYEWRGIPEYWIVDPVKEQISVLFLTEEGYEQTVFAKNEAVVSPTFPEWALTAAEMLSA
ncbi:Uma2 family endonuclease [Romeria aff. gracilis LEGE 07310]|uniref:Uma2 family endonuclease n=1 Tax=Vasconcelosia minhoensis LEGE 07310 TaxID=915328 RepID=A0A8J7DRJ3_9CYAN|nr:Uma2 family endonuclease [Romeria gracilis]MBE9078664.1 Uma2 family endonuclease [Romeria aff. gracilis LEGE 07310]